MAAEVHDLGVINGVRTIAYIDSETGKLIGYDQTPVDTIETPVEPS
jgi:hypothetical protein